MRRKPPAALLLLLAALPLRAQQLDQNAPTRVSARVVQAEVDQLHDAVASPAVDNYGVHARAAAFFDGVPSETPVMRPTRGGIDRERVDGHEGSIDGMLVEAQKRWELYKNSTKEVPDQKLGAAIAYARELRRRDRIEFDAGMPEKQMGEFRYPKEDASDLGAIKLNERLTLLATRIGEAFSYATLVHEAAHAKARADGRLDPARTIDNEIEAYRVQCLWLKAIDPRAERMVVMISTLKLHLQKHPTDDVSKLSLNYVEHLLEIWDTDGEAPKLRELIKKLGYQDGGVDPAATAIRA
ncbi:MAG: hypothetical protein ACHQ2Z_16005 [Elusimicrobiota bacterium]